LLRLVVGGKRPDEADLLAELCDSLSEPRLDDRELAAIRSGASGERSSLEVLTEVRLRRSLATICERVGADTVRLPRVVLAHGAAQSQAEATLSRWDLEGQPEDLPDADQAEPLGVTFDPTVVQATERGRTVVQEGVNPAASPDQGSQLDGTLRGTRLLDTLAQSLGVPTSESAVLAASIEHDTQLTVVLTDECGVAQVREALADSDRASVALHRTASSSSSKAGEPGTGPSDSEAIPSDTVAKMHVLEASETIDAVEKVLLWSLPSGERAGLLRRAGLGALQGQVIGGKYLIQEQLDVGGFGIVYKALDRILKTPVAIKVLKSKFARREDTLKGFLHEAQRLTAVDHPNIVRWISFDRTADGLHYFVMEYLKGEVLLELMKREGALDWRRSGELLLQVLDALRAAHELPGGGELLHLDLKPQNVFVLPPAASAGERVKVIDFGISRFSQGAQTGEAIDDAADAEESSSRQAAENGETSSLATRPRKKPGSKQGVTTTAKRVAGGTVLYSSPEQCKHIIGDDDLVELDGRADLYSLGVMAFEMLTGQYPFKRPKSPLEAVSNHLEVEPSRVHAKNKEVPKKLGAFVDRLLEKDRDARWPSAHEAHQELHRILHPISTRLRYLAAAAVIVAAAAVTWALNRDTGRRVVEFDFSHPGAETVVDLRDKELRLEVGGAGRWLFPKEEIDPASVELVTDEGEPSRAFDLVWQPESSAFLLSCSRRPEGQARAMSLQWSRDGQEFASPLFKPVAIPPFELPSSGEDLLTMPPHAGSLNGVVVLPKGVHLRLDVRDQHGSLDDHSAQLMVEGQEAVEFESRGRSGTRARYELALDDLPIDTGQIRAHVELRDEFDHVHRIPETEEIELSLVSETAGLQFERIVWQVAGEERAFLTPPTAGKSFEYIATEHELHEGNLVLTCSTTSPSGEGRLEIRGGDGEVLDVEILREDRHDGAGVWTVTQPLSELPRILEVVFEDDVAVAWDRNATRRVEELSIDRRRSEPCTLELDEAPLSFRGVRTVRSGDHRLSLRSHLPSDCWLEVDAGPDPLWRALERGSELELSIELQGDRPRLRLGFHALDLMTASGFEDDQGDAPPTELLGLLCRRTLEFRIDDHLELQVLGAARPTDPNATVPPDYLANLEFAAEAGSDDLDKVRVELHRNGQVEELSDLEFGDFRVPDWGDLRDGAYVLEIQASDRLGNEDRDRLSFHVNESGPTIEFKVPGKTWRAPDGELPVEVRVQDLNGLDADSVELTVEAVDAEWSDGPVRLRAESESAVVEAGYDDGSSVGILEDITFSSTLEGYPASRSGDRARLEVKAKDAFGLEATARWETTLATLDPVYEPTFVSTDGTTMRLVQPPRRGSYAFAEFDLASGREAERSAFEEQLLSRKAHYAEGEDLDAYLERFVYESPPPITVDHVDIEPYYLDEHEVSRGQFLRFLDAEHGYLARSTWLPLGGVPTGAEQRRDELRGMCETGSEDWPMEGVTWSEAWAYAHWAGKRLPTYLEWEYAVRAGGGDSLRLFACERIEETVPVPCHGGGEREANVYAHVGAGEPLGVTAGRFETEEGFWHLGGNVREWTSTPYVLRSSLTASTESNWLCRPHQPGEEPLPDAFWVVGADYAPRDPALFALTEGQALWPEHDFKQARKQGRRSSARSPWRIGFRCAIDAVAVSSTSKASKR